MKQLKTVLRESRKKSGLSYRELAIEVKIPWANLRKMEVGISRQPTFKTVMKICKYFKLDPFDIIT